jgi:hypothetical protein
MVFEELEKKASIKQENRCLSYGFNPGTIEFSNCLMKLDLENGRTVREDNEMERGKRKEKEQIFSNSIGDNIRRKIECNSRGYWEEDDKRFKDCMAGHQLGY